MPDTGADIGRGSGAGLPQAAERRDDQTPTADASIARAVLPPSPDTRGFPRGSIVRFEVDGLRVVLDYYTNDRHQRCVIVGKPEAAREYRPVSDLLSARRVEGGLDPEGCRGLLTKQYAERMVIVAAQKLRHQRRDGPEADRIPPLRGTKNQTLRKSLLKSIVPDVAPHLTISGDKPPFTASGVELSTVVALVSNFFDKRQQKSRPKARKNEIPDPKTSATEKLKLEGSVHFVDPKKPITATGPNGSPIQLVAVPFVRDELEKRRSPDDKRPLDAQEIKKWIGKYLIGVEVSATAAGIGRARPVATYQLSDVITSLNEHPLRGSEPRLNSDGRAMIEVDGRQIEVLSVDALTAGRAVSNKVVEGMLSLLEIQPVPGITMKGHDDEVTRKVYRAEEAVPFVSTLLCKDGVALPVGNYPVPYRIALPVTTWVTDAPNPYHLKLKLDDAGITAIKLDDLKLDAQQIEGKGAHRGVRFYMAEVPRQSGSRIVMTDQADTMIVYSGSTIQDSEPLYWVDDLQKIFPKAT